MVEQKLHVPSLTCEACEKVIRKALDSQEGIASLDFDLANQTVVVDHAPDAIPIDRIISLIQSKGYEVALPGETKKAPRTRQGATYLVEKRMLKTAALTFLILLLLEGIAYFGFFRHIDGFLPKYSAYLFYLIIAVVANAIAVWHISCYRQAVDCMSGMMIGMTIGMMSGFMGGAVVGATNGMFIGSVYGMVVGMAVGAWCGKCCGIMGLMEGLMAGLMGGTMGAMLSVMMVFDHPRAFMALLFLACLSILFGLAFMVYEKNKEHGPVKTDHDIYDISIFIMVCYLITLTTTLIIIYGPKQLVG